MSASLKTPEITPQELARALQAGEPLLLVDVREPWEVATAALRRSTVIQAPLSDLSERGLAALPEALADQSAPVVVICHHGRRSARVTNWLLSLGWKNVRSLAGGLEDYAVEIDPGVGRY